MTKAVYDPANISQQLVGTTASQAISNKQIDSSVIGTITPASGNFTSLGASGEVSFQDGVSPAGPVRIYNTYTDPTSFEALTLHWSSDVALIQTEKGAVGGSNRDLDLRYADGTTLKITGGSIQFNDWKNVGGNNQVQISTGRIFMNGTNEWTLCEGTYLGFSDSRSNPPDVAIKRTGAGILRLTDGTDAAFDRLQFGGTSSSFPGLERNGPDLEIAGADGSATGGSNLILSSPDGTKYRITVSNLGVITTTAV